MLLTITDLSAQVPCAVTQFIEAVAHLLGAVAWPAVVGGAFYYFKPQIIMLSNRLEEVRGLKFGRGPNQTEAPTTPPIATASTPPQVLSEIPRTPATKATVEQLRNAPLLANLQTPADREEALLVLAARIGLIAVFLQVELYIWGSQVALLQHLNARPAGDSRDNLRTTFYEPTAPLFPDLYRNYSFDQWLGFLQRSNLIAVSHADDVTITDQGREYLVWRVEARRPSVLSG